MQAELGLNRIRSLLKHVYVSPSIFRSRCDRDNYLMLRQADNKNSIQECQAYADLKFNNAGSGPDGESASSQAQSRQSELDERMKGMAQGYAFILMKEGYNYKQVHNEKIFFEALYDFTVRVTNQRFGPRLWRAPYLPGCMASL